MSGVVNLSYTKIPFFILFQKARVSGITVARRGPIVQSNFKIDDLNLLYAQIHV